MPKSGDCELQKIAADLGLRKIRFEGGARKAHTIDASNPCLVRDQEKCILCGRCIRVCRDVQGMSVYSFAERGFDTIVSTALNRILESRLFLLWTMCECLSYWSHS